MKAIVRWLFGMALWVGMMFLLFATPVGWILLLILLAVWAFGD